MCKFCVVDTARSGGGRLGMHAEGVRIEPGT